MKIRLFIWCMLFMGIIYAQNFGDPKHYLIDSLHVEELDEEDMELIESELANYHNASTDTARAHALNNICEWMYHDDYVFYVELMQEQIEQAIQRNPTEDEQSRLNYYLAKSYIYAAADQMAVNDFATATQTYQKAIQIGRKGDNPEVIASAFHNLSVIHSKLANYKEAIQYATQALLLCEKYNITQGINTSYGQIAIIYKMLGEFEKALEYNNKSLELDIKQNDIEGMSSRYNNIAVIYNKLGRFEEALDYYHKSIALNIQILDQEGEATAYTNIGSVYYNMKQWDSCLFYLNKGLVLRTHMKDEWSIANSKMNIGKSYTGMGRYADAVPFCEEALAEALRLGDLKTARHAAENLYENYKALGNTNKALKNHELFIQLKDSISSEDSKNELLRQSFRYEYEKKKEIDDKENEKLLAIASAEEHQQKLISYFIFGGLLLTLIFAILIYKRLQLTRRQKVVIENQKEEVESQKKLVEEKNQEITDSIQYAKRIQSAILPPDKLVKEYLENSFILYKPKDIVAGDFYWMETVNSVEQQVVDDGAINPVPQNTNLNAQPSTPNSQHSNLILFAAADCTGHGVPGAMVSVICNNGLNRAVREHGLTDPGQILDKTREIVVQEFEKSEEDVKDGMDIALCCLKTQTTNNKQQTTIEYAGANNPLWIIRPCHPEQSRGDFMNDTQNKELEDYLSLATDNYQLLEIKADKQPIGKHLNPKPYTTHTVELQEGDTIYIFSDGFADQFGGENGKKMKTANFKKLLLSIQNEDMASQRKLIDEAFEGWKGELEQLDDVCVIGVKI